MNSEEYDIIFPEDNEAFYEVKDFIASFNEKEKPFVKRFDYGSFINGLLNNPSTTKQDRERIVNLLLKERDKGFVTEERVKELIMQYGGEYASNVEGKTTTNGFFHNPKNMVSFLYQFSVNDMFKWFTHEPDANFEFDYETRVKLAEDNFNKISKGINPYTWNNVKNFVFNTNSAAKDSYNEVIKYRWKDMSKWCFEHKFQHPFSTLIDNYKFAKYIDIFKNTIEFRNLPKFSDRMEDYICDVALNTPDVKLDFTDAFYSIGGQLRVYIDVRQLFFALKEMCKWIIENKSKGNRVEISVEEKPNTYVLSLFHINSYMTIDAERIKGLSGDFKKVRNILLNVADWTIEADVNNSPLHIECLNDKTKYVNNEVDSSNLIEPLSNKVNGVRYLITLYKNIQQ